jgi:prepilin-type N-terminal cleavage/methylation domain-containing protein
VTRGFTIVELLVALLLMLVVAAGVFAGVRSSSEQFLSHTERADMQQRARIAADTVQHALVNAAAVRPYRWGGVSADPPGTFKADTITLLTPSSSTTFWLKQDDVNGVYQLMSFGGGSSADVPVVDNVVALRFAYLDGAAVLAPSELADGPWLPDAASADRWDADLARVRVVAVTVRVQAAIASLRGPAGPLFRHAGVASTPGRWAPDVELQFRVAPRPLNGGS